MDMHSQLDHQSCLELMLGDTTFPFLHWSWHYFKTKMKYKILECKKKLIDGLSRADMSFKRAPEVPYILMKFAAFDEQELELLICLSMMAKPQVHVPLSE